MTIFVTGGAGFIGSHLVDILLEEGHKVIVIDDFSGGSFLNLQLHRVRKDFNYLVSDCRNEKDMDWLFKMHKPEIVYHLAANAAENKAQFSPIDITSRNYDAFIKVLTPFIKYGGKRFVFTSSIAVYGKGQTPFTETDKPEPEDLYGITKLAAEQTLKVMSAVHGFEYVIARPHNVFGERQNMSDPYRNVVTIWMNAILRNEPVYIYGDGEQRRQFSYVDMVVRQLYRCGVTTSSGTTYNIGTYMPYTLNELWDLIVRVTKTTIKPEYLPLRPQEVVNAIADHTLALKDLRVPQVDMREALINTWNWCKMMGAQEPIYTELELPSDKVPKNWVKERNDK